jgi:predicted nucleic acid-binding Zn ribbon protein
VAAQPPASEEPQPLAVSLDRLLRGLGAPPADALSRLADEWPAVVGHVVADHAQVVGVERGRLMVDVDDAAYATHVRYFDRAVREWLDGLFGPGAITRVDVRVRPR